LYAKPLEKRRTTFGPNQISILTNEMSLQPYRIKRDIKKLRHTKASK